VTTRPVRPRSSLFDDQRRATEIMVERKQVAVFLVEARATPEPNTGCLLWTGALEGKYAHRGEGYAVARTKFGKLKIIRALLGLTNPKVLACHKCNIPACVNERHLYAGNNSTNILDSVARGTHHMARKTHCLEGHLLDGSYLDHGRRVRYCKTCRNERQRRRRAA